MLDTLFQGLFDTALTDTIAPGKFLLCVGVSLLLGLMLCAMTLWRSRCGGGGHLQPGALPLCP